LVRNGWMGLVRAQSFGLGVGGILLALPCNVALARAAIWVQTKVILSGPILSLTFALTLAMAMLAGLSSLRSLRTIEPARLLRLRKKCRHGYPFPFRSSSGADFRQRGQCDSC
jgi:hypothetical protein